MDVNVVSLPSAIPWTAIISSLTAIIVLISTLVFNYKTNNRRLDQEQEMNAQRLDQERAFNAQRLEHEQAMMLIKERRKAYALMARIAKNMDVDDPFKIGDLADAHSEIEMLTEDAKVLEAAEQVLYAAHFARQAAARKKETPHPHAQAEFDEKKAELNQHRTTFINLTREEVGLGPRPSLPTEEGEQAPEEET